MNFRKSKKAPRLKLIDRNAQKRDFCALYVGSSRMVTIESTFVRFRKLKPVGRRSDF
jgi:hypothetical protein